MPLFCLEPSGAACAILLAAVWSTALETSLGSIVGSRPRGNLLIDCLGRASENFCQLRRSIGEQTKRAREKQSAAEEERLIELAWPPVWLVNAWKLVNETLIVGWQAKEFWPNRLASSSAAPEPHWLRLCPMVGGADLLWKQAARA